MLKNGQSIIDSKAPSVPFSRNACRAVSLPSQAGRIRRAWVQANTQETALRFEMSGSACRWSGRPPRVEAVSSSSGVISRK